MATKVLSNEFMQRLAIEGAWKELSRDFSWSEAMLEKYQDKVDWSKISKNMHIQWTIQMIQKFCKRIKWDDFSYYAGESILVDSFLDAFKDQWNWSYLSHNYNLHLTYELLDKYAEYWDWEEIIRYYSHSNIFQGRGIEFYERYKKYIPESKLKDSALWDEIVSQEKRNIIEELIS